MASSATSRIVIEDQGPRDGFQSEKSQVPTELKVEMIHALADAGVPRIQVCSFVHPKYVPQMADAEQVCAALEPREGVLYSGLVLNEKGIDRAISAGLSHIALSHSASDTHSRKNTKLSLAEAQAKYVGWVQKAKDAGLTVRGGLQCVFGCRYEGRIDPDAVLKMVEGHLAAGVDELALADSTGMADPRSMRELMTRIMPLVGDRPVILHLHDTEGRGMANALSAMECGVTHFDTAFAGMGGCPYIKGASGNISTEDLAAMAHAMGYETGVDVRKVAALSARIEAFYDKQFPGKMHRVLSTENICTFV